MNSSLRSAILTFMMGAPPLAAQGGAIDPQCRAGTANERATQDACQKAVDLFGFMAPQLGASIVGGNAVLGEARSLGGLGHLSLGLRANAIRGKLPSFDNVTPAITGATATAYQSKDQVLGLPAVDVAMGLVPPLELGGQRVFGLDLLANLAFIPEVTEGEVAVTLPGGSLKVGLGARVSLLEESHGTPSVSISFLQRDLPVLDVAATPGADNLSVDDFTVTSDAWRAAIGKTIGPFSLVVGGGKDRYDADGTIDVSVNRNGQTYTLTGFSMAQSLDRTTLFADLSINLPVLKIGMEVGQVRGGSLTSYNTFGVRADRALQYASLGLRLRW